MKFGVGIPGGYSTKLKTYRGKGKRLKVMEEFELDFKENNLLKKYRFVQLGNKIDFYLKNCCFTTVNNINLDKMGEVISLVRTMIEMGKKHYLIDFKELKSVYGQKCQYNYVPKRLNNYSIDRLDNIRPAS